MDLKPGKIYVYDEFQNEILYTYQVPVINLKTSFL